MEIEAEVLLSEKVKGMTAQQRRRFFAKETWEADVQMVRESDEAGWERLMSLFVVLTEAPRHDPPGPEASAVERAAYTGQRWMDNGHVMARVRYREWKAAVEEDAARRGRVLPWIRDERRLGEYVAQTLRQARASRAHAKALDDGLRKRIRKVLKVFGLKPGASYEELQRALGR